ncbi:MAG TPA: M35 family metallo-endopeptidase [Alloacidobacterium sp.]|nr:M35 family metallo-endopeptidase [Alloacidobacterium sp.]
MVDRFSLFHSVRLQACGIVSAMFAVAEMERSKKQPSLSPAQSSLDGSRSHRPLSDSQHGAKLAGQRSGCSCGGSCSKCQAEHANEEQTLVHNSGAGHNFGSMSVERKDGVVHGPAGGANSFTDCPTQWKPAATAAQRLGANWLDNVVNGLGNLPRPIPAPVSNLLTHHFHTTFDKDLAKILDKYGKLNKAINQSIDFQCETKCDKDVLAYVYSIWSDLHLCPYWFSSNAELQASTVIHELAHDVVGCDDNAYEWETTKYNRMSVSDAMDNADSYAHFARDASRAPAP